VQLNIIATALGPITGSKMDEVYLLEEFKGRVNL